jgi:predicted lipase
MDYDRNVSKFAVELISRLIVYKNEEITLPPEIELLKKVYNYDENPVFGIVAKDKSDTVWIAFRGTDNIIELIEDAMYRQKTFIGDQTQLLNMRRGMNPNAKCHSGFLSIYQRFREEIKEVINNYTNIVISGYSLGGAVATIAGLDIAYNLGKSAVVYTFASPMVGNKEFAEQVDSTVSVYRHINTCDIVHNLPNSVSPNFLCPSHPIMYQHCGIPIVFTDNWFSIANNHYITVYKNNT